MATKNPKTAKNTADKIVDAYIDYVLTEQKELYPLQPEQTLYLKIKSLQPLHMYTQKKEKLEK